jgi:hypothetical protein
LTSCSIQYEIVSGAKDDTVGGHTHQDATWTHQGANLSTFSTPSKSTEHSGCSTQKNMAQSKPCPWLYPLKMMKLILQFLSGSWETCLLPKQ